MRELARMAALSAGPMAKYSSTTTTAAAGIGLYMPSINTARAGHHPRLTDRSAVAFTVVPQPRHGSPRSSSSMPSSCCSSPRGRRRLEEQGLFGGGQVAQQRLDTRSKGSSSNNRTPSQRP